MTAARFAGVWNTRTNHGQAPERRVCVLTLRITYFGIPDMLGLHFVSWPARGSGCLGAAAPVTGAAADEYNLNVVDCNASVTVARRSSISVSGGLGGNPQPPEDERC